MSKTKYSYGLADSKSLAGSWGVLTEYRYEMRYSFNPKGYEVVKRNLINNEVEEVIASGLKHAAAEGFIKILGETK